MVKQASSSLKALRVIWKPTQQACWDSLSKSYFLRKKGAEMKVEGLLPSTFCFVRNQFCFWELINCKTFTDGIKNTLKRKKFGGGWRSRTVLRGFADRSLAARASHHRTNKKCLYKRSWKFNGNFCWSQTVHQYSLRFWLAAVFADLWCEIYQVISASYRLLDLFHQSGDIIANPAFNHAAFDHGDHGEAWDFDFFAGCWFSKQSSLMSSAHT